MALPRRKTMSQRTRRAFTILSWSAMATLACSVAVAQDSAPPSVAEQLQAQYKIAKLTRDANGNAVIGEGTALAIQKQGILGLPLSSPLNPCPSTYVGGRLKKPGFLCQVGTGVGVGLLNRQANDNPNPMTDLPVGQQVYPASIAVDTRSDTVKFMVIACAACNGTDPPTYYKAQVDFRFPKGVLATGDASQVEDTIGQVFSIDNSGDAGQAGAGPAAGQASAQAPASPAPAAPEPLNIQQGQTIAQVEQALGKPSKILTAGTKVIYVYRDLKVTFTNGKVADVQ